MMMGVESLLPDPDPLSAWVVLLLLVGVLGKGGLLGGEVTDNTLTSAVVTGGDASVIVTLDRAGIWLSAASNVGLREVPSGLMLVLTAVAAADEESPERRANKKVHMCWRQPLGSSCGEDPAPGVLGTACRGQWPVRCKYTRSYCAACSCGTQPIWLLASCTEAYVLPGSHKAPASAAAPTTDPGTDNHFVSRSGLH
jgi:hypothetical protein